jgi:hypothetical protein
MFGNGGGDHFRPGSGNDFCDGGPGRDKPGGCERTVGIP